MATNEIVIPGFGTGGGVEVRNGEPTYDKKYKVYNGHLINAKTKGKIKILKKRGQR
jgi:RNA-binding protein YlmH